MTDQEKRNAINTATINFYKNVRNNVISKVINVIQTAGSSAATETTESEEMTISLSTSSITVQRNGASKTINVFVTCEHSYTLATSVHWCTISGNDIIFSPDASVSADTYTVTITATDTVTGQKASTTLTVVVQAGGTGGTIIIDK